MKKRPILFSAPMIRAILDGSKTQTRRVMKVQPPSDGYKLSTCISTTGNKRDEGRNHWVKLADDGYSVIDGGQPYFSIPYGGIGDQLWVREAWQHSNYPFGPLETDCSIFYRADYFDDPHGMDGEKSPEGKYRAWKPSIHMPRWASRIQLEITGIRVEKLQDISEEDALAEGVESDHTEFEMIYWVDGVKGYQLSENYAASAKEAYQRLWESINGPGSWDENPWVWVIEFERCDGKEGR